MLLAMKTTEERLADLEMRYTEQEDTLQKLSEVVRAQELALEELRSAQRRTHVQLDEIARDFGSDVPNEKPPHY